MNIKSRNFRKTIFYIGVTFFILSLLFSSKLLYEGAFFLTGILLMYCYPVNYIKRKNYNYRL